MKKRFKISWSEQAALDLERLISYISAENPKTAGQILKTIRTEVSQLDHLPFRGRIVPEFEEQLIKFMHANYPEVGEEISKTKELGAENEKALVKGINEFIKEFGASHQMVKEEE